MGILKNVGYGAASLALVGLGTYMGSCGSGVSSIDEVEFPGGNQGLVVIRSFTDVPFVKDSNGTYVRYTEEELMQRAKKIGGK